MTDLKLCPWSGCKSKLEVIFTADGYLVTCANYGHVHLNGFARTTKLGAIKAWNERLVKCLTSA